MSIDVGGETLSALHLRLPNPRGVVFFLHGNTGNLATWFTHSDFYRAANYDLFMLDYRGYGKSSGRIESEAQLRADVLAAWQAVEAQYAGKRKVIYGRSLGTALAAGLAAEVQPDLTILVSPYCRHGPVDALALSAVADRPPALSAGDLRRCGRMRGAAAAGAWRVGPADSDRHSEQLLSRAPQARLLRVAGAAHADVHQFPAYTDELRRALKSL
ncbi:MAG: alpha/beta fold hydrolase [Candidatus Accumulibacter propinquus]